MDRNYPPRCEPGLFAGFAWRANWMRGRIENFDTRDRPLGPTILHTAWWRNGFSYKGMSPKKRPVFSEALLR